MKKLFTFLLLFACSYAIAQNKKPLTHDVYDGWKSVGERAISNNGKIVAYTIVPQEGDGVLVIQNVITKKKTEIDRGYGAIISQDNEQVVFKIKPKFKDTRDAKIKKKKADEMPKDSLGIYFVQKDSIAKIALVKSFKAPEKGSGWIAYLAEKPTADAAKKKGGIDSLKIKIDGLVKISDSIIRKSLDSVKGKIDKEALIKATEKEVNEIYKNADDISLQDAEGDDKADAKTQEGTELFLKNTKTNADKVFKLVSDYLFDKKGTKLLIKTTKNVKDSNSVASVLLYYLNSNAVDTIMRKYNDAKNFVFDEDGTQLAFVAERDSATKALQKFYKLWYVKNTKDTASLLADKNCEGIAKGLTVSENANLRFSKDGSKLFFGTAIILPAKDTNLVDFELARLDVWHYKDDYLQPQQLKQLQQELKRSYSAVIYPSNKKIIQLANAEVENVAEVKEGNANYVLAQTDKGNRVAGQWEGRTLSNAYTISTVDGTKKSVAKNNYARYAASPNGKYIYWYDAAKKNYFTYNVETSVVKNITEKIKMPLYDTENDVPDFPSPAGFTGWVEADKYILLNDEYDIWKVDPDGIELPTNITNSFGRKNKTTFDYINLDPEKRFINAAENILLRSLDKMNKQGGLFMVTVDQNINPVQIITGDFTIPTITKAKNEEAYLFTKANSSASELYFSNNLKDATALTDVALQQKEFNWYTTTLVQWKMFDNKPSQGILYKPENFDPTKKYPVIFYFYERNADQLNTYKAPAPSASTVNIPYFTSNGYLVFDPNIYYKDGEPGNSAYNSVVSAAKMLSKLPWVDSTRMAIQGQSWGGYQVAYLVTKTNIFRAASAGAPVSNMTSAYGGIRWGTGLNRQFQYEKTQSRIGATLWQRPDLYIKNSPLFAVDKIKTPLLLMHNDADGSVPWYQGIEMFTAMRRLNKPVWLLQYNDEDHNLVERKNRKDLSVRLAQFFDYWLKDAKPAEWMINGLPATKKGINWGLDLVK
jgi:dipeptidyl aminopeptidase/acylaminoacyl peptidase